LLRELWLGWRARRLGSRMELMRSFLDAQIPMRAPSRASAVVPSTWRDLEALEHLLEERRAKLGPEATPEQLRELFTACDQLGIVDRYIRKLQRSRGWAERAFAARYLGEIGSATAVTPLIEVMRNTREEDREVRMAAGRALGRIRDPRAIEPLIEALAAPESWLPARVAELLLQFGDATFDALVALLNRHDDSGARPWAAQILGDLGSPRAVGPLLACLTDLNDQVRARAASSLGRLGDRRAVPELIRIMLGDPVPYVRIQVVRALGTLGDPRSLHHLIDALKDGEWWVRIRVVEALEQLGDQAVEPLFLALEDGDNEVRQRAAMTLERLGVLDTLVARLADVDAGAREKLLAAGQSGVVEILIGALEHEDPRVRYMIAEILGEVRNTAVEVALIGRLEAETDPRIRSAVVRSLAQLQAASGAQPISRLLGDADERIRVEAVRALERIHVADPHVLLAGACRDPEPRVRAGAAVVLGKVGDARAVPQLLALLSDADAPVRVEAARAVGLLHAEEAVPRLMESLHDTDPQVQVASARALGQIGSPACLEVLARGLEGANADLGAAIAWAVGQIRWDDPEKLIDVLFQGNDRSSRLGVLAALGKLDNAAGRELIRTMLHDEDQDVVIEAVAKLGELEDAEALPALHELLASPVEATRLATIDALRRIGQASSLPVLRQAVFDPSPEVRARAVLALAYRCDVESAISCAACSPPNARRRRCAPTRCSGSWRSGASKTSDRFSKRCSASRSTISCTNARVSTTRSCTPRSSASANRPASSTWWPASSRGPISKRRSSASWRRRTSASAASASFAPSVVWAARAPIHRCGGRSTRTRAKRFRVAALQFLANAAPAEEFFRLLIDALEDLQPRVRAEALRRLQDVPVDKALPLVLSHLASPEPELQAVLVDYLTGLPDPALDQFLDGVLGSELDVVSRSILVRVLGRVRHRDAACSSRLFSRNRSPVCGGRQSNRCRTFRDRRRRRSWPVAWKIPTCACA
jgi:HEAT repeat protein